MESFKSIFVDNKINIIIPQLQRDYVQGLRTDVIEPFLSSLVDAIINCQNNEVHLNYIYGYNYEGEDYRGFVPIDGQQRLTTLWLLHLYIYSKFSNSEFPVDLIFLSREYAGHFAFELKTHMKDMVLKDNFVKTITSAPWFIPEWKYDKTVKAIIESLRIIELRFKSLQKILTIEDFHWDRISFQFLNMSELGLSDDIYVKMNGRGRPLTYFENLKSWMDNFGDEEWKTKMDNEWESFFWHNRNKNQEHPEDIDDERRRLFYSLILIYWLKHQDTFLSSLNKEEFEDTIQFLRSIPKNCSDSGELPVNASLDEIKYKLFNILRVGKLAIPIYWIEKLQLINNDVLDWIKSSINVLTKISKNANLEGERIYFNFDHSEKSGNTKLMYDVAMNVANYESTLPLLYGFIRTPENCQDDLHQWMRLMRNLVLNSSIDYGHILKAFSSIDNIAKTVLDSDVLNALISINASEFEPFCNQLKEEKRKAQLTEDKLIEIEKAENIHTFRGRVSFIFDFISLEKWSSEQIKRYTDVLAVVFPNWRKNKTAFDNNLIRRALVSYPPHYIGNEYGWKWHHVGAGDQDWKDYLCDQKVNSAVKSLLESIIESQCAITHEGIEEYLTNYINGIDFNHTEYWHYFSQFSEVWTYMESKYSNNWDNDNDIILFATSRYGENIRHAELRAYCLWRSLRKDSEFIKTLKDFGWQSDVFIERGFWEHGTDSDPHRKNTCLFINKRDSQGNDIGIDIYFKRKKTDDFAIEFFLRPQESDESQETTFYRTKEYFKDKQSSCPVLSKYPFDIYCYASTESFSWDEVKHEILRLVRTI